MRVKVALVVLLGLIILVTPTQVWAEGFGEVWSEKVREPLIAGMKAVDPTVYEDYLLVVGGRGNKILAYDVGTGEKLWEQDLSVTIVSPLSVVKVSDREVLVVALTSTNDLFAMNLEDGTMRIKGLKLGIKLLDSRPVPINHSLIVPTYKGALLVDLSLRKVVNKLELSYTVNRTVYVSDTLYFVGDHNISAYQVDFSRLWELKLDKKIIRWGFGPNYGILISEDLSLISIDLKNGKVKAEISRERLGIKKISPAPGEIPVRELAHIAFSDGTLLYIDPTNLKVVGRLTTFKIPVYQPIAAGNALVYMSNDGNLTLFDYRRTRRLLRMSFEGVPSSNVVLTELNTSYYAIFIERSGLMRVLSIPKHIPVISVEEKDGKYSVEGYLCRIEREGEPATMGYYIMAPDGKIVDERPNLGSLGPGRCGLKFSFEVAGPFLLGVVFNGEKEYPVQRVGGAVAPPPTPTATQTPVPQKGVEILIPDSVVVGDYLIIRIKGSNVWNVKELTVVVSGPNVKDTSETFNVGDQINLQVKALATEGGEGKVRVEIRADGRTLNSTEKVVEFKVGDVASVNVPKQVSVGDQFNVRVTIINRIKDGGNFTLKVSLDGQSSTTAVGTLKLGEKKEVDLTLKATKEGLLNLRVQVLVDGKSVYSRSFGVNSVKASAPATTPAPSPTRPRPAPPPPTTGQQGGMIPSDVTSILEIALAVVLVVGVILLLRRALVRPAKKRRAAEVPPIEVPTREFVPHVEEESFELVPEEVPEETTPEEEFETPREPVEKFEEFKEEFRLEPVESEITPPVEEKVEEFKTPEVEEFAPSTEYLPPPIEDEVVELLDKAKRKLSSVKLKLSELEDILGFEAAPYKLTDVESKIMNAEMAYKVKNMKKAKDLLEEAIEDLDSLEREVDEAKKALVDGWGSVESRIDVMLKVWGRAPANMLTMVPPGFRIIALERYRRMHEDKKLELRGDELYLVE